MPSLAVPLPETTLLRLLMAQAELDKSQLQAQLLQSQAHTVLAEAQRTFVLTATALFAAAQVTLPPAVVSYRIDAAQGCLVYEVPDELPILPPQDGLH
jgi:hypothetical protein